MCLRNGRRSFADCEFVEIFEEYTHGSMLSQLINSLFH